MTVPSEWMPKASMQRIIAHWSAGAHKASELDKEHYHIIVEGGGTLVRGDHEISDNEKTGDGDYAAHTRGCNTGSIGVSLACMAGAIESPFNPGKFPMTKTQWDALMQVIADLCLFYKIKVTPKTVLSHAEVQGTLGIKQRGKWDFTRLAFDPSVVGAKDCGDKMRAEVSAILAGKAAAARAPQPDDPGAAPEKPADAAVAIDGHSVDLEPAAESVSPAAPPAGEATEGGGSVVGLVIVATLIVLAIIAAAMFF